MKRMGIFLSVLVMVIGLSISADADLVDMHDGTIYDTDTQLSWLKDAGTGGARNWADANSWAAGLNVGGLTGWRLPAADPACGLSYYCTNSEIGHLYYTELGNVAGGPLSSTGPFINLQANLYSSGTAVNPADAWCFYFDNGLQSTASKGNNLYAWAVRPGVRAVTVGYNLQWLLITIVSLTLVGGILLRRKMVRR